MNVAKKRNIVLLGHAHCGKTSLAESILFKTGATDRKGDVMQGTSISDFNDDERERHISINSSLLTTSYKDHKFQIMDTPGYADFIGDAISAIKVADSAVLLVDAQGGIEVGTDNFWQRLEDKKIPRIIFINKTEKDGVNLDNIIADIKEQLSSSAHIIDLSCSDLIESVAESDDQLLEKYLEEGSLTNEEVAQGLRNAVLNCSLFPIVTGSALKDEGVDELLNAIIDYCPSPLDHPAFDVIDPASKEHREMLPSEEGAFAGYVFKSIFDTHLGNISLMKILRGKITSNSDCYNVSTASKEHIGNISLLQGKEQSNINEASCGDIVALSKLKNTHVCDCISDKDNKIMLDPIEFPQPAISSAIKPKTRADEEKIAGSLNRLCEEDHTFKVTRNTETKELIVSGLGDLHLKVVLERMKRRFHVDVDMGIPKVTYREAITRKASARYKHKKQSGGRGQYADVALEIEPLVDGSVQFEFVNKIFGGAIPKNFIPSIEKGIAQTVVKGVLAGYHVYGVKVTVVDGSYHDVDSSDMAFQIAGANAFKNAFKEAGPVLMEPIMEASITVPDEYIGQISGDLSSRRGRIMGATAKGKKEVIVAQVPLSEMFTYSPDLKSMTGGRGSYTMKMDHYEHAPAKVIDQEIAKTAELAAAK